MKQRTPEGKKQEKPRSENQGESSSLERKSNQIKDTLYFLDYKEQKPISDFMELSSTKKI